MNERLRFNAGKRNALYPAADGKCARSGVPAVLGNVHDGEAAVVINRERAEEAIRLLRESGSS